MKHASHDRNRSQPDTQSEVVLARALQPAAGVSEDTARPEIVCLCGSSRFIDVTAVLAWELEKEGKIVLAMHLLPQWYTAEADHQAEHEGIAAAMDTLHLRKIDLANRVMVVNPGGYYGESTRREIAYARARGKPVLFTDGEPDAARAARRPAPPARADTPERPAPSRPEGTNGTR